MLVVRHHAKPTKYYISKEDIYNVAGYVLLVALTLSVGAILAYGLTGF